ncbi:hypothetical protein [Haloferula sp.]|uniref:hypothetical protein n=1 Tax=Haloferula sp. TaxID=2497595 RepID=UPI00329AEDD0
MLSYRLRAKEFCGCALGFLGMILVPGTAGGAEPGASGLGSPSQAAINAAIAKPLIDYDRNYSGGAHTWGAFYGGASITLAVASHAGNTSADARLLQQIRHILTPGREPTANGGYPSQHERHVTGMFVIARNTPRIWDQLSEAEKDRTDLIMKATLVATAFTTSDNNPFIAAGSQQYSLDGGNDLHRDWNPNHREGMFGGVLVGMVYFGGPTATNALLNAYDHSEFVADLSTNNLPNLHETFNWKAANPSSNAPSGSMIETAVGSYRCYGIALPSYMAIYDRLVNDTYGKQVNSGLNGGAGISGAGKIVSGAAELPNPGAAGMLKEFESIDAGGARSSFHYAYDGYRPHMTNQICLIVGGYWSPGTASTNNAVSLMNVGNTDLWYKAEKGYIGYAKGKSQGVTSVETSGDTYGFVYNRSLWEDVLMPYHGLASGGSDPGTSEGARMVTTSIATLHADASASSQVLASLQVGTFGSVIAGPVEDEGSEWWQVRFDSGFTGWVQGGAVEDAPASEAFIATAGGSWLNHPLDELTGSFTISYNMRPAAVTTDSVVGLSAGPASEYNDLAVIVRVSQGGIFDARDGGNYVAANPLSYTPGVTYRVTCTVDIDTHRYSATVTPPGEAPVLIADDFAFRSEQSAVTSLGNLAIKAEFGSQTVTGILLEGGQAPTTPALEKVSGGMRITYPTEPGNIYQLKSSVDNGNWTDLGDPLSTVGDPGPRLFDFADSALLPKRFYRIEVSTP